MKNSKLERSRKGLAVMLLLALLFVPLNQAYAEDAVDNINTTTELNDTHTEGNPEVLQQEGHVLGTNPDQTVQGVNTTPGTGEDPAPGQDNGHSVNQVCVIEPVEPPAEGPDQSGGAAEGASSELSAEQAAPPAEGPDQSGGAEGPDQSGGAEGPDQSGGAEGPDQTGGVEVPPASETETPPAAGPDQSGGAAGPDQSGGAEGPDQSGGAGEGLTVQALADAEELVDLSLPTNESNPSDTSNSSDTNSTPPTPEQPLTEAQGAPADDSTKECEAGTKAVIEIINTKDITAKTDVYGVSDSGNNSINSQGDSENGRLGTGEVNVYANVLNVLNTSLTESKILEIVQNYNNLSTDVLMNQLETDPYAIAQDLVSSLCEPGIVCQSISSFKLSNQNKANLENNVGVVGNSGENAITNTDDEVNAHIGTGRVNALVNILNIVNANLVNSRWTIASVNIFGDWEGDLVMPSELYFEDFLSVGTTGNTGLNIDENTKVTIAIDNKDTAKIENNVNTVADTGNNEISAPGDEKGKGGDMEGSNLTTGEAEAKSNIQNVVDTTVVNGKWFLGMINSLGTWAGDVYSLPEQVAMTQTGTGLAFFAAGGNSGPANDQFQSAIADVTIENQNEATIVNNVDVYGLTGENEIVARQVEQGSILTGNARVLANILNFANTNLINADLYVGMINIFGHWQGNVLFGYPDLSVTQSLSGDSVPGDPGRDVKYNLSFGNSGNASAADSTLEWQYDPELFSLDGVTGGPAYEEPVPGKLLFNLSTLNPFSTNALEIDLTTLQKGPSSPDAVTYARVSTRNPERQLLNNESVLSSSIGPATEGPVVEASGNGSGTGTGDGSGGGTGGNSGNTGNEGSTGSGDSSGGSGNTGGTGNEGNSGSTGNGDGQVAGSSTGETGNNNTGTGSGNTNTGGGSTSGSGGGSSTSGNAPDSFQIFKINDWSGSGAGTGDTINFTISVLNGTNHPIHNVFVYDNLRNSSGELIDSKKIQLDTVAARERIELEYSLEVTDEVLAGTYTNSAYATGINHLLEAVQTSSAISSFTVGSSDGAINSQSTGAEATGNSTENGDGATSSSTSSTPLSGTENAESSHPPVVLGATTDNDGSVSGGSAGNGGSFFGTNHSASKKPAGDKPKVGGFIPTNVTGKRSTIAGATTMGTVPNLWESVAPPAKAMNPLDSLTQLASEDGTSSGTGFSPYLNMLFLLFLIALGYAAAKMRERMSLKRTTNSVPEDISL